VSEKRCHHRRQERPPDALAFHLLDGRLVLTVPASAVWRCAECEDVHVTLLRQASRQNLLTLAAGIAHLAEHVEGEVSA